MYARARTDSPCRESFVPHTPPHTTTHHHTHHQTSQLKVALFCCDLSLLTQAGAMDGARVDAAGGTSSARRRRERRLRSMLRHERMAVAMALAEALHHSSGLKVMERAQHAALRGQETGTRAGVAGPAPVVEYVAPASAVTYAAPAPVIGYVAPVPAVTYAAPATVIDHVAPAPAVTYAAPATVIDHVAPAPVFEYIASAPAVSFAASTQQLRPAYTADTVATGVNLDAAVVGSASQVVGSLPLGEVFAAPVFPQVHQEQFAGDEIPENFVQIPVVQQQVIVQASLDVGSLSPVAEFTSPITLFIRNIFLQVTRPRILRIFLLCRNRCSFRLFLVSLVHLLPLTSLLPMSRGGRHLSSRCGRLYEHSGMLWSSSPTLLPWSRFWTFLCRRRLNSCLRSSGSWTRRCRLSRLLQCPRSLLTVSRSVLSSPLR